MSRKNVNRVAGAGTSGVSSFSREALAPETGRQGLLGEAPSRLQSEYRAERDVRDARAAQPLPDIYSATGASRPDAEGRGGYTPAQLTHALGIQARPHHQDQTQLDLNAAGGKDRNEDGSLRPVLDSSTVPSRWEDLPQPVRHATEYKLRKEYGVNEANTSEAISSQLGLSIAETAHARQQGVLPSNTRHAHGGDWYLPGGEGHDEVTRVKQQLNEEGIPASRREVAGAFGPTSRNTAFWDKKGTPQNSDAAEVAVRHARGDLSGTDYTNPNQLPQGHTRPKTAKGNTGRVTSPSIPDGVKVASAISSGASMGDAFLNTNKNTSRPPAKTGAYSQMLSESANQPDAFRVTDVHSVQTAAPELGKAGGERLLAQASDTFRPHEFFDYVSRNVGRQFGGFASAEEQPATWDVERTRKGETAPLVEGGPVSQAYGLSGQRSAPHARDVSQERRVRRRMGVPVEVYDSAKRAYSNPRLDI